MKNIRVNVTISTAKIFIIENKKLVISCLSIFLVGLVFGIGATIIGCEGVFISVNTNDIVYGSFKMLFRFTLFELAAYMILLLSVVNFALSICAMSTFWFMGFFLGKYACVLVACFRISGILNLIFIYLPVFFIALIHMTVAIIKITRYKECSCTNYCYNKTVNNRGKNIITNLKPSVSNTIIIFGINVSFNFVIFIILGLLFPVIVV